MKGRWWLVASIILLSGALAQAEQITVSAAVSLKEAITEVARAYKADTHREVQLIFGSSGQLKAQIRNGAPVDCFISAANQHVNELVKEKIADEKTRRVIARNRLVLVVPANEKTIDSIEDLSNARVKRIAIGEPTTVPAGTYAMQVLKKMNLEEKVSRRLVFGANVRQVLDYVRRGEANAGFVYATDAVEARDKVKAVATADERWHDPIVYPAVVITASRHHGAAVQFLDYFKSEKATKLLAAHGFLPPGEEPKSPSSAGEQ